DYFIEIGRGHSRPGDGFADHAGPELGGLERGESPEEPTGRCADRADDDGCSHGTVPGKRRIDSVRLRIRCAAEPEPRQRTRSAATSFKEWNIVRGPQAPRARTRPPSASRRKNP